MATIVTRASKGSALTWAEGDANITNLNTDITNIVNGTTAVGVASTVTLTADNSTNATNYPLFVDAATGNESPRTDTGFTYNPSTGTLTATTFSGSLSGNATSATTATTATGATNINISTTTGNSNDTTLYPVFVANNATGNQAPHIDDVGIAFNASTNALSLNAGNGSATGKLIFQNNWPANVTVAIAAGQTSNTSFVFPTSNGSANQVLSTDGTGVTSWTTPTTGTVTSVAGTGTVNGLTLTGTVTSSGSLTLGGTLSLVSPPAIGSTTPNTGAFTTLSASSTVSGTGFSTYLASPPAIGGTAAAAGSFTTLSASTSASLKAINEGALYDLGTTGGTVAPNVANGNVQKITLNSALTINAFTSPVAGQSLTLIIYGGTSYTSITSTMKFAGGIKTLTGTAGCIDILSVYYDGTNYFASLAKGFA